MGVTTASTRSAPAVLTAAGVALSLSMPAKAVDWKITPSVVASESYTDNIRLAPRGTEQSDYVTELTPKLLIKGTSRRLNASLDYEVQNFAYDKTSGKVATSQHLDANATAELSRDLLFCDAKANIGQQSVSPFGPYATSNLNITNNLAEVRTVSVSPYFKHKFGSTLDSELRFTTSEVTSDATGYLSSHADSALLNIASGEAFHTLPWGLQYNYQKTSYRDGSTPFTSRSGSANVRYPVTARFSLTATAGHESNSYLSTGPSPSGPFWTGGFAWNPTERTSLSATAGHRFFGTTHSFDLKLRSRTTVWTVNYNEDITTSRSQFLVPATIDTSAFLNNLWKATIPDPAQRQSTVDAFIQSGALPPTLAGSMNLLTNRIFLQKAWQASVGINGARNTVLFTATDSSRDAQSPGGVDASLLGNAALEDSTHQTGLSALWSMHLSPRTDFNLSSTYSKIHSLATDTKSTVRNDSIAMIRQLQPKVKGSIEWRHVHQVSGVILGPIDENVVAATLQMGF
jgi:uncharacterized protein (PEP-CTERM system associated)